MFEANLQINRLLYLEKHYTKYRGKMLIELALSIPKKKYNAIFKEVKSEAESDISDDSNKDYLPSPLSSNSSLESQK